MNEKSVWHKIYGNGIVVESCEDYTLINFEKVGEKKIANTVWGLILFFTIEDYKNTNKNRIKEKYKDLIYTPKYSSDTLIVNDGNSINTVLSEELNDRVLIEPFVGSMKRNIVIILCQKVVKTNNHFLRVVGIDVFSGKTVNIVDTNGSSHGLHSYNEEFVKLREQTVIQADFKIFESIFHLNTLRIVSEWRILGKSNVPKLRKKYMELPLGISDFIFSFDNIFEFCSSHKNSNIYLLTNFSDTQVNIHKNKYQLKMGSYFVDILDQKINIVQKKDMFYHGWTILHCYIDSAGKYRFTAQRLIGKFLNEQEHKQYILKKNQAMYYTDNFGDLNIDEEFLEESFDYDEEDDIYRHEDEEELIETYKEYADDILDEYQEYQEGWDEEDHYE